MYMSLISINGIKKYASYISTNFLPTMVCMRISYLSDLLYTLPKGGNSIFEGIKFRSRNE